MIYKLFNHDTRRMEWSANGGAFADWVKDHQRRSVSFLAVSAGLGKSYDYFSGECIGPDWMNYEMYYLWRYPPEKATERALVPVSLRFLRINSLIYIHNIEGMEIGKVIGIQRTDNAANPFSGSAIYPRELRSKKLNVDTVSFSSKNIEPVPLLPQMLMYLGIEVPGSGDEIQLTKSIRGRYSAGDRLITVSGTIPRPIRWVHELQYLMNWIIEE